MCKSAHSPTSNCERIYVLAMPVLSASLFCSSHAQSKSSFTMQCWSQGEQECAFYKHKKVPNILQQCQTSLTYLLLTKPYVFIVFIESRENQFQIMT